ncbi:MAG: hypothetical protein O3B01_31885 [Planctomycetota bacterium]|nr:hypothetical protein [Planctomycetota bacterium]MDA1143184.1 hypothetical protein [Planctomycetota bacterium]
MKRPVRGIVRPMRDIAIYLIWKQGSFPLVEIGEDFHGGDTSISNARIRGDAALREDRKVRSMLKEPEINV